jgi:hypothetical protein
MGLRFISDGETTAMYDSVTGWAFGPTFSTVDEAERFLAWCETQGVPGGDVRVVDIPTLQRLESLYYKVVPDDE